MGMRRQSRLARLRLAGGFVRIRNRAAGAWRRRTPIARARLHLGKRLPPIAPGLRELLQPMIASPNTAPASREQMLRVRNDLFDARLGLDRGRPFWIEACWYLCKCLLFLTPLPVPSSIK